MAIALAACSAIPLSTVARLAAFGESDFASLDARELRVRVSMPEGYAWDVDGVKLATDVDAGGTHRNEAFQLSRVGETNGARGGGMFSPRTHVRVTTLRLAERSMGAFRELQRFMAARKAQSMRLDVQLKVLSAPPGASSVKVWIDVMPSTARGYFTLVDGGTIPLNRTKTFGSSGS